MLYLVVCLGKSVSMMSDVRIPELRPCPLLGGHYAD